MHDYIQCPRYAWFYPMSKICMILSNVDTVSGILLDILKYYSNFVASPILVLNEQIAPRKSNAHTGINYQDMNTEL